MFKVVNNKYFYTAVNVDVIQIGSCNSLENAHIDKILKNRIQVNNIILLNRCGLYNSHSQHTGI